MNLFLQIVQEEDCERLEMLLDKVNQHEQYFKPPWPVDGICDKGRFETKTRKDHLSQTGK